MKYAKLSSVGKGVVLLATVAPVASCDLRKSQSCRRAVMDRSH
jgi:hypothetical protein